MGRWLVEHHPAVRRFCFIASILAALLSFGPLWSRAPSARKRQHETVGLSRA